MLKFIEEAVWLVLKMIFHSRVEDLLVSNKESSRVLMGVSCLLCGLFMCNVKGYRDGYPVQLSDGKFYHLLNVRVPCSALGRVQMFSAILNLAGE